MTFSALAKLLYPLLKVDEPYFIASSARKKPRKASRSSFVIVLIDHIIAEGVENPLVEGDLNTSTLSSIFNGTRSISKEHATDILRHLDKERFRAWLMDHRVMNNDSIERLCKDLYEQDIRCDADNYDEVCANVLEGILHETAKKNHGSGQKQQPETDEARLGKIFEADGIMRFSEKLLQEKATEMALKGFIEAKNMYEDLLGEADEKTLAALNAILDIFDRDFKFESYFKFADDQRKRLEKKHGKISRAVGYWYYYNAFRIADYPPNDYLKAINSINQAIEIFDSLKRSAEETGCTSSEVAIDAAYPYAGLGYVYNQMERHQEALAVYERFVELAESVKAENERFSSFVFNGIGTTYMRVGDYAHAEKYLMAALALRKKYTYENPGHEDQIHLANTYQHVADLHMLQNQWEKALFYAEAGKEERNKITALADNHPYWMRYYQMQVSYHLMSGNYDEAIRYLEKEKHIFRSANDAFDAAYVEIYIKLSEVYEKKGDPVMALEYGVYAYRSALNAKRGKSERTAHIKSGIEKHYNTLLSKPMTFDVWLAARCKMG